MNTINRDRKALAALSSHGLGLDRFKLMDDAERDLLSECNPDARASVMAVVAANNERLQAEEDAPLIQATSMETDED